MREKSNFSLFLKGVLALGMFLPASMPAAEALPGPLVGPVSIRSEETRDVNKFLFIISTSSEMKDLPYGGRQTLFELIHTGTSEYMRKGDTFGVWIFNSRLRAGEYPMQMWHPSNAVELATQATLFVDKHNYRSRSDLDEVMAGIQNVMQAVEDANIFIISDYKVKIKGTPFDDALNQIYKERGRESRQNQKPFITTILARGGSITTAGVTLGGEPISLPTRPPPLPEIEVAVIDEEPAEKSSNPSSAWENRKPEIIVSKSGTVSKRSESGIMISGPSPSGKLPLWQPELERLQDDPSFVVTPEFERAFPAPLAVPQVASEAGESASAPEPTQSGNVLPPVAATTPVLPPTPDPAPETAVVEPKPNPAIQKVAVDPSPSVNPVMPDTNESSLLASLKVKPIPVSAREPHDGETKSDQLGMTTTSMTAMANPVKKGSKSAFWFYAAGAGLLLVFVFGLVYWMAQRRADTSHTSYITKSMYRK